MKKILYTLFALAISTQVLIAQSTSKADRLFEKRRYNTAANIYSDLEVKSQEVLEKLGDCYYYTTDMKNAAIWYNILIDNHYKNNTIEPIYLFKYAQALKGTNNTEESDKWLKLYNDSEHELATESLNTKEHFAKLNTSIDRPFILHQMSINTEGSDFGVSIQGDKAIFASTRKEGTKYDWNNQPYLDLYEADVAANGDLINPKELNGAINTKMHESNGVLTKDGNTLYFSRNNYTQKKVKDENKVTHLNIYKASLVNGEWANVIELPFNNANYSMMHPALNFDESRLYFSSDMPGSIGSFDLFYVDINSNGTFGEPINLGDKINTPHREQFPYVSSKHTLYFASDGHFGMGGLDIYSSEKTESVYGTPLNLSDIVNSGMDDFAFVFDEENEVGYFSSNRQGGKGDDDIYRITKVKQFFVEGKVQDKSTLAALPGTLVQLFDKQNNKISEMKVDNTATFSFEISKNASYTLKGSLKTYESAQINFSTDNDGNIDKDILLALQSYEKAEEKIAVDHGKLKINIDPIFFYFDSWDIIPESAEILNEVVTIMKKYPEMVLEVGNHTDSRGDDEYNLMLSEKRGNAVREYLVSNGVQADNVKSVGYGETQLLNRCTNDVRCWEREHFENRRSEFIIVN